MNAIVVPTTEPAENFEVVETSWDVGTPLGYCCEVRLSPDPAGGFTAYLPSLPGVVSEGDDQESALNNIAEAAKAIFQSYLDAKVNIPWINAKTELKAGEIRHRIAVRV